MATILHVDASARVNRSISRDLSASFVETWLSVRPDDTVLRRDVGQTPPGFVTESFIEAVFTEESKRTAEMADIVAESDELIAELEAADVVVIGTPMYNYGMPATLKAWIDMLVRVNRTFSFDLARGDFPLEPILGGKTLAAFTSKGEFGFEPGGVREHMNYLDGHIEAVAHYLGLEHRYFVHSEYQEFGDDRHDRSLDGAKRGAIDLARKISEEAR